MHATCIVMIVLAVFDGKPVAAAGRAIPVTKSNLLLQVKFC
jgi:hypothetical protein